MLRTKGSAFEAVRRLCDIGTQVCLLLTEGQNNDDTGARHLLPSLPQAAPAIADCGYDADWLIATLKKLGVKPCIPPRKNRK